MSCYYPSLYSLIARRRVGPQTQWRPLHKAFTSGLGLDAISLAWPPVVQLVVSFNSDSLGGGLAKSTLSLFRHSSRVNFVFSLRCIDWVRKPLCEPNFLCIFCIKNYIGTQGEVCKWKAFKPPVVYTADRSKAVVPMLFLFCVSL